jgi:S-layer homology domain
VSPKPLVLKHTVLLLLLLGLPACANSPWAGSLERSLAADPQLENNPNVLDAPQSPSPSASVLPSPSLSPSPSPIATPPSEPPQPGDPNFVGPIASANPPSPGTSPTPTTKPAPPASGVPTELQTYISDLNALGALPIEGTDFAPSKTITRREYARWLVTANNLIYANLPARKVRLGTSTDQPAFQDVGTSDRDFGAIQGLANAGLIPSTLSGDSTVVTFRPNAPLTREDLILWKVPVDIRRALPNATVDAVKETWGFQDTAKIDPKVLRAVLADYQNSDLSNIRRAFGYTTLFNPKKAVTRAEAAAVLWFFGAQGDGLSAKDALQAAQPSPAGSP